MGDGATTGGEYTAGVLALLKHYVRNWGRSPEQREPLSDASLLPKLSEVEPFLSAEQREIITSAQARLLRFRLNWTPFVGPRVVEIKV